jgi:hypothetical protein
MFSSRRSAHSHRLLALAVIAFLLAVVVCRAQLSDQSTREALTADEIVTQMQRHNQIRADDLKHYQSLRHYEVRYKGLATIAAKMDVEANYDSASGKTFRIVSQSGSGFLVDKVLKRLIETEKDASSDKKSTALTSANYKFHLKGTESVAGRPAYILDVDPLVPTKYLYRGKIWIDAIDFAVAKIEAAPAKNPSFWISSTAIHHQYTKTEGFWLPEQNRSETKVRLGGTAVLTIDYGTYQVVPGSAIAGGGS